MRNQRKNPQSKHRMFHVLDCVLILGLAVFVLLDTFVITREYSVITDDGQVVQAETSSDVAYADDDLTQHESGAGHSRHSGRHSSDSSGSEDSSSAPDSSGSKDSSSASSSSLGQSSGSTLSSGAVVSASSYEDENISITINEYRYNDTTIYVADVQVSSIEYLSSAFANSTYGKNVKDTTSSIADTVDAILAINGDFYGARNSGYVLRNGVLYRDTAQSSSQEDLVINSDGSFSIVTEGSTSASQLAASGALQVYSFGPALIVDGEISVDEDDEVGKAMASNPRTAICEIEPLHYLFVVSDGRTDESVGLSLKELAEFLQSLGVETAYNLDGGGSSTMVFNGTVINNPTTGGTNIKERSVSDIVYIGYR